MRSALAIPFMAVLAGCGPDAELSWSEDEDEGDGVELARAELTAGVLLAFVNSADATFEVLTADAHADSRAASGIVAARNGPDGVFGTTDDRPFRSVAELDAVPWVGDATLAKLDSFALARQSGAVASAAVIVDSVAFTAQEAAEALAVANGPKLVSVGLYSTPYNNLVARRPFSALAQVGAVPYVGTSAMTQLRTFVQRQLAPAGASSTAAGCTGRGGTYDGVTFTRTEECHAVDFLNRARFSEMPTLPDFARLVAYQSGPSGIYDFASNWTSLQQFSSRTGIGGTALAAVKSLASGWTANGLPYDTVAASWTNRARLLDKPIYLDRAYVKRLLADDASADGWSCAELRDSPSATNYLIACVPRYICEFTPDLPAGADPCWTQGAGVYGSAQGKLRSTSLSGAGGVRLSLNQRM